MGFLDDLKAAVSFGKLEGTKAREARESYEGLYAEHQRHHRLYTEFVNQAIAELSQLLDKTEEGRTTIIDAGAMVIDQQGNVHPGWYFADSSNFNRGRNHGSHDAEDERLGFGDFKDLGQMATKAASLLPLRLALTPQAAGIGLGIGTVAAVAGLAIGFWQSKKKDSERIAEIERNLAKIERSRLKMDSHRGRLEALLPEINPLRDHIEITIKNTRTSDAERRKCIEEMRAELTDQCDAVEDNTKRVVGIIRSLEGTLDQTGAVAAACRQLASATARLQSDAERHEDIVNSAQADTASTIEMLGLGIRKADQLIRQANSE